MRGNDRSSLVSVLHELGSGCCEPNILEDILTQIIPSCKNPEGQIAQSLFLVAESALTDPVWNPETFMKVVLRTFPKAKRLDIVKELDFPEFFVPTAALTLQLLSAFKALFPAFYEDFPFKYLFMKWNNIKGQLSLIHGLLLLGPESINFSAFPCSKVVSNEDINLSTVANRNVLMSLSQQTWNCYEIYDLACKLVDTEFFEDVRPIFELASRQSSELLCIALAMFNPSWNSILKEILVKLTCGFLLGQASSSVVLPRIWNLNPSIMLLCMVEMHRRDPTCLSRLLDVAQDLKILAVILDAKPHSFALDVGALASRRQHLNLEKWLAESMADKGPVFMKASIEFLSEKIRLQSARGDKAANPHFIPIAPETVAIFLRVLQSAAAAAPSDCQELLKSLYQLLGAESSSPSQRPHESALAQPASEESVFSQDVQDEVNSFFEKIYTKEFPVDDVIELLKKLRSSAALREQQLFSCFVQNLFDEYRFFAMYPDNELSLTATIFGAIIKHQLISHVPLGVGLRYVLEALKKPSSHKLFKFGLHALMQFQRRLNEWPQYCSHLLQIPHLCQAVPQLAPFLQAAVSGSPLSILPFPDEEDRYHRGEPDATHTTAGSAVLAARSQIDAPNETIRERILFVLNNMSSSNLEQKVTELRKVLMPVHYAWFAQYLVVKRASTEVNLHHLYVLVIENFGDEKLLDLVMRETFGNIDVLLKDPKTLTSTSERLLLKNLGIWLGSLTLARDRPIMHDSLSIKDALIDAVINSKLLIVIPFACKVLEQGMHGRIFRPLNPYLMGSLRLLVELYKYADMKLNLKFEIEVLCKNLGLDIKNIKPSNIIKDISRLGRSWRQAVPSVSLTGSLTSLPDHIAGPLMASLTNLLQMNKLSPQEHSGLLKIFPLAVEYAVRELAVSVCERSISIASVTAKSIASKDFSGLSDMSYVRSCALRLTQYLAGNLALASLKESMRQAVMSNIRTFLQIAELANPFSDVVWTGLIEENIDNFSGFIEHAAAEKVAADFDQIFSAGWLSAPRAAEGPRPYETYEGILSRKRFESPDFLSLEDVKAVAPGEYDQLVLSLRNLNMQRSEQPNVEPVPSQPAPVAPAIAPTEQSIPEVMELFVKLLSHIERACAACEEPNVAKLHPDSEVRRLMKQVVPLASALPSHRDELCLLMCQRLMQLLYKNGNVLFADVIILLLVKIFEFSIKVAKEVTTWIIYSEDERKYNVLATWALFNSGLIYVLDYDAQLARQLEKASDTVVNFTIQLIRKCVFEEPAVAAAYDFVYSLDALKIVSNKSRNDAIRALLDDLNLKTQSLQVRDPKQSRDVVLFWFTDWFRLCQYPSISEKLVDSFLELLFEKGFFREESLAKNFFQVCTEAAVEIYVRQRRSPAVLAFRSVEAFAKLTFGIIRWASRPEHKGVGPRELLVLALKVVTVILAQGLEQSMDYLQKPFSRYLVCFVELLEHEDRGRFGWILDTVGELLVSISPMKLPKFSFAWFEILSSSTLLSHLLQDGDASSLDILVRCVFEALDYMQPIAAGIAFSEPTFVFYKGLLKLFAVVLHDRPDIFVSRYVEFCDHMPKEFVQLRNLVLSAVPNDISLPDPLSPGLKIDTLEGMKSRPEINAEYVLNALKGTSLCSIIDEALVQGSLSAAQANSAAGELKDSVICNALVSYCGLKLSQTLTDAVFKSATLVLYGLLTASSPETRYHLLSAMANHLRYPNCLTYFFSCANLYIFRQAEGNDQLTSQLVRVLLERLIVYRPHPWGLMITFMELIRNPEYRFWSLSIIKSSPEVQKMFETVAKSCLVKIPA